MEVPHHQEEHEIANERLPGSAVKDGEPELVLNERRPDVARFLRKTISGKGKLFQDGTQFDHRDRSSSFVATESHQPASRESSSFEQILHNMQALQAPNKALARSCQCTHADQLVCSGLPSSNSCLPWVVLYCGANMNVAASLKTASKELRMTYRREWFGEW
ncbi:unnamed protein product [Choristocarpus tenellus]